MYVVYILYIYICTYMYTLLYTYIRTYIHTYTPRHVYGVLSLISTYIHTYMHACMHVHTVFICVTIHKCTYAQVCMCYTHTPLLLECTLPAGNALLARCPCTVLSFLCKDIHSVNTCLRIPKNISWQQATTGNQPQNFLCKWRGNLLGKRLLLTTEFASLLLYMCYCAAVAHLVSRRA
jgi:hypothetical protein